MNITRGVVGWLQFLCSHSCFDLIKGGLEVLLDEVKIIGVLEVQPDMRTGAKPFPESQCGFGGDGAFPRQNLGYPVGRHMDILGQFGGAYLEFGKFLGENFTGVYGSFAHFVHL